MDLPLNSPDLAQVYTDFSGLNALKARARDDEAAALDEVARQFESMFTQMMLKSMRAASLGEGMFDSKQSEFYRDMYDQQLSVHLSEQQGIGLADMLKRQLGGSQLTARTGLDVEDYQGQAVITVKPSGEATVRSSESTQDGQLVEQAQTIGPIESPQEFLQTLWPVAQRAAAEINLPPEALLAQAALETGWGQHVMPQRSGASSHNLFGIKADSRWDGDKVRVDTLEYKDGIALKTRADFRAYASYEDSFNDYVQFIKDNPRYAEALQTTQDPKAYFSELQKAGYATDPVYAEKIGRILNGEAMQDMVKQQTGGTKAI